MKQHLALVWTMIDIINKGSSKFYYGSRGDNYILSKQPILDCIEPYLKMPKEFQGYSTLEHEDQLNDKNMNWIGTDGKYLNCYKDRSIAPQE